MALDRVAESEEDDEEYHSFAGDEAGEMTEDEGGGEQQGMGIMEPPVHPVASMQAAFEESIVESATEDDLTKTISGSDAETRRRELLEAKQYDEAWTSRWQQSPSAKYHPLLKLMAQIVFGMHLLQQQQAKSDDAVVKILQTHVNEVDSFLERTSEDFDFALADIEERIRHLKLPMQHLEVFNSMLADRNFRTQLLEGNDKIERIIDRTARAMNGALADVQKGQHATQELGKYLEKARPEWPRNKKGIVDVYGAMRGNEHGWMKYLGELQKKGGNLGRALFELGTVIGEMSKLAAAASRRERPSSRHMSPKRNSRSTPNSPGLRSKFSHDVAPSVPQTRSTKASLNKPLPKEPQASEGASRAAQIAHPVPFAQRYEQPRASPYSPPSHKRRTSRAPAGSPPRPKTSSGVKEARDSKLAASDLKEYLKNGGPLRSNPPDRQNLSAADSDGTESATQTSNALQTATVARSKTTHGGAMIVNTTGARTSKIPEKQKKQLERDKENNRPSTRQSELGTMSTDKTHSLMSEPASRKDSVITASTGFARRLSKRMKHLPPSDLAENDVIERPHVGTTGHGLPSVHEIRRPSTAGSQTTARRPNTSDGGATPRPAHTRQPSKLGLFPRTTEPLTPTRASVRAANSDTPRIPEDADATPRNDSLTALPGQTSLATPAMSTRTSTRSSSRAQSAFGAVRNIFHRKQRSQGVFATS